MRKRCNRIHSLLLVLCLLVGALGTACQKQQPPPTVSIDVLKIGKADCIVINTNNHLVMIDTGEHDNLPQIHAYMQERQYGTIDMLIISHYDKDHIGGINEIITSYGVKTVIEPHVTDTTAEYVAYHNTVSACNATLQKPTERYDFTLDGCDFSIDVPQKNHYKTKHDNNISLIVSMRYGEKSFLFCGDAMEERLEEWMGGGYGRYDFVKLPYHGNELTNYTAFLDVCMPSSAAITCSKKNPPSQNLLSLLAQYGTTAYLTSDGTVHVTTDGASIVVHQ